MKYWPWFVALTVLCWGAYVPTIHHGQKSFGPGGAALRAFLFIGTAYFLVSIGVLAYTLATAAEPMTLTRPGVTISLLAGVLGAIGALGIVFALKSGGKPLFVAPLVFSGAPIVNTLVSMIWDKPAKPPSIPFYLGIVLVGVGAALVLRFKPA